MMHQGNQLVCSSLKADYKLLATQIQVSVPKLFARGCSSRAMIQTQAGEGGNTAVARKAGSSKGANSMTGCVIA